MYLSERPHTGAGNSIRSDKRMSVRQQTTLETTELRMNRSKDNRKLKD